MSTTKPIPSETRADVIFKEQIKSHHARTSRMFAWLMGVQWLAAVVAAVVISPYTWIGEHQRVHEHVWIALVMGGVLASLPIGLAIAFPAMRLTRHVIAVAQVLFSALLIHLTGGRVETHFHVFGSLAFLAFYRDWRVIATATVVVAMDHMIRGLFLPLSVFGTTAASQWRWVEHAGWVVFEDVILVFACVKGLQEMRGLADRQAQLEMSKEVTEAEVRERTKQLSAANDSLQHNQFALTRINEELISSAKEREILHQKLLTASREAGMAEVAIGVLHNVGNILNSVNVSANVVSQKLRNSEVPSLVMASGMITEHSADLGSYLQNDPRGKHLPPFLVQVSKCLSDENAAMLKELEGVMRGVDHVKHVISMQQSHAKKPSLIETIRPHELLETAVQMQVGSLNGASNVAIEGADAGIGAARLDKHRILQILINLIKNARQAIAANPPQTARVSVSVHELIENDARTIRFEVSDNGMGIAPETLANLFSHGFTTRADGHGFGLHTAATAAQAMGGSLKAFSDGPGKGARFVLTLPELPDPVSASSHQPVISSQNPAPTTEAACTGS